MVHRWLMGAALGGLLLALGCGTMNTARPLEVGQHAVGVTGGGPLIGLFGTTFPFPSLTLEGRTGLPRVLNRPLDLNYGLHLTPLIFGDLGAHLGASYLVLQQDNFWPALSVSSRLYAFSNAFDGRKPPESRAFWALDQLELTLSYSICDQLLYAGVAEYLDFGHPDLLLAPFVGVEVLPWLEWLRVQLEVRYYTPYRSNVEAMPDWVAPLDQGGLQITGGLSVRFDLGPSSEEGS